MVLTLNAGGRLQLLNGRSFDLGHWRKNFQDRCANLAMKMSFMWSQIISMSLSCDLPNVRKSCTRAGSVCRDAAWSVNIAQVWQFAFSIDTLPAHSALHCPPHFRTTSDSHSALNLFWCLAKIKCNFGSSAISGQVQFRAKSNFGSSAVRIRDVKFSWSRRGLYLLCFTYWLHFMDSFSTESRKFHASLHCKIGRVMKEASAVSVFKDGVLQSHLLQKARYVRFIALSWQ
jgi:hypothetical protein